MNKVISKILVVACFCMVFWGTALYADTIFFPYIASDGANVTTIVSIVNKASESGQYLTFIYRYKTPTTPLGEGCSTTSLTRPTIPNDLITFDVAGIFSNGNAMYNDTNSYGGSFKLPVAPMRGYLLVTHSNASGSRVSVVNNDKEAAETTLYGEAVLLDITSGAAWGYRAENEESSQDYNVAIPELQLLTERVSGGNYYSGEGSTLPFFPLNIWTTKLFVTSVGINMNDTDYISTIKLVTAKDTHSSRTRQTASCGADQCSETEGVFTRDGISLARTGSGAQTVKCMGAINIDDLLDATQKAQIENSGGWAILYPDYVSATNRAPYVNVYKLEYVLNNSTYGGTNNNAILLSEQEFF